MLVAIPSKGRAGKVKSQKLLPDASTLFVPAAETDAYDRLGGRNIVAVPDDVLGITRTRNWILDWADAQGEPWVVFIDDDVKVSGWIELLPFRGKHRKMQEAAFLEEWVKLFDLTAQMNYRIWGLDTAGALRSVYPYHPFRFQTYVTASCMGIRNDTGIRFDEDFPVKEDYEMALRCIVEDGGILGAQYFYWVNAHWAEDGGCKAYRTGEMEKDCIDRLIKMYPGIIRRVKRSGNDYSIQLDF